MRRRKSWQKILDAEVQRWSALSCEELEAELRGVKAYEVAHDSMSYQVEVQMLENTDRYLHIMVAVDDGSLPASFRPLTQTFIRDKQSPPG
jgi:hypothetical protein